MITTKLLLASTFIGLHYEGGSMFMFPLLFMLIINIGIIIYVTIATIQSKQLSAIWLDSLRRIATLAAVWGTFSTLIGLFFAFTALEASPEPIPFPVICGGLRVALLTVMYGLIIYCISYLSYCVLKVWSYKS